MAFQVYDERFLVFTPITWNGPAGYGAQDIYGFNQYGQRFDAIQAVNEDSIDHVVRFDMHRSGQLVTFGRVIVPAGAGNGTVPAVDCIAAVAPPPLGCVILDGQAYLEVTLQEPIVDAVNVYLSVWGAAF